jgi:hypothetical protein
VSTSLIASSSTILVSITMNICAPFLSQASASYLAATPQPRKQQRCVLLQRHRPCDFILLWLRQGGWNGGVLLMLSWILHFSLMLRKICKERIYEPPPIKWGIVASPGLNTQEDCNNLLPCEISPPCWLPWPCGPPRRGDTTHMRKMKSTACPRFPSLQHSMDLAPWSQHL